MAKSDANTQQVPYPGQWRLARVDMANWGTFNGYQSVPVDRRGMLLTGPSGSGKSTVLDAVATVLTPPSQLSLNAAANNGGQRDKDRSISNYVRGVWGHHSDNAGEVTHNYLRAKKATWSGVMLRYEDGVEREGLTASERRRHEPVNLLAIFFQKSNTTGNDGLKRFYAVIRGDCILKDFETYGVHEADMTQFNKDYKDSGRAWREHTSFESHLCTTLHIDSPKTLVLLHKTQAAKNIGSLDELFRKYMLDTPRTFALADAAVEQFGELSQAHEGVVDQRKQMECLQPLLKYDEAFTHAKEEEVQAKRLLEALSLFTDATAIALLEAELDRYIRKADSLAGLAEEAKRKQVAAVKEYEGVIASLGEQGYVALESARLDVDRCKSRLLHVTSNRDFLAQSLASSNRGKLPDTHEEFEALKRTLTLDAQQANKWLLNCDEEKVPLFGKVSELRAQQAEINNELRFLRSQQSNIPSKLHAVRVDIAKHLGLSLADVPFIGELIDVKPDEKKWQGALERLLGGRARTMLVEKRHAPAINEYLESKHLGVRFEYDAVPDDVSVPDCCLHVQSLVRKILVVQVPGHESLSQWVNKLLRERFNYVCVDSPADMEHHARALTLAGQVKNKEHHVKDDRHEIADKRRWVLGSTNDQKIERLEQVHRDYGDELIAAQKATSDISAKEQELRSLCRTEENLRAKVWEDYDGNEAARDVEHAQRFVDELASSDNFREAEAMKVAAQSALDQANESLQNALVVQKTNEEKVKEKQLQIAEQEQRSLKQNPDGATLDEGAKGQLSEIFSSVNESYRCSVATMYQASAKVERLLGERTRKALGAQQDARRKTELILQEYKLGWQVQAADLSATFEDRSAYIDRYKRIKNSGLPEYEHKFLEVLTNFSRDQITVISTEIRGAFHEVKDRLEPVNRSLLLSEYRSGIHLQIEVRENRGSKVDEFLTELKEITAGTWAEDDLESAERRYTRTAAVMKRLGSTESADRSWRTSCLNTPDHMKFIAKEMAEDGAVMNVYSSDGGLSGGQKQKLVFFCLAAALRYQLADEDQPVPTYGTIILDEAFDKSDRYFAEEALGIFEAFGFHMILATPGKLLQTAEDHIGSIVMVTCEEQKRSRLSAVKIEAGEDQGERR